MFLDLMDISQANMLFDLELILSKLNKALIDFKVVKFWQDELLFYNAQLRDGKLHICVFIYKLYIYLTVC